MPLLVSADGNVVLDVPAFEAGDTEPFESCSTGWHIEIIGTYVRIFRTCKGRPPPPQPDKRAIGAWSIQSRMRMLRFVNSIDYSRLGPSLFVTLTYPDHIRRNEYPQRTQDRNVFLRYVETYLGRHVSCLWRIEWEERQSGAYTGKLAPHLHLMLFNVNFLSWQRVRMWWRKSIGAGPGPLVTETKRIYNEDGACRYLSKYVSKYRSLDILTYLNSGIQFGRHWGCTRVELVPICPPRVQRELLGEDVERVFAYGQHRYGWRHRVESHGFTLFGKKFVDAFDRTFGSY